MVVLTVLWLDATAWTAIGTIALAVAGTVGVLLNVAQVKASRRLVESTAEQVAATRMAAEGATAEATATDQMVREIREDRELAVQPVLVYEQPALTPDAPRRDRLAVKNIGKGPALLCYYVSDAFWQTGDHRTREIGTAGPFALGSGQATEAEPEKVHPARGPVIEIAHEDSVTAVVDAARSGFKSAELTTFLELMLCQDQFGTRYRFMRGEAKPEISRADDRDPPEWTTYWKRQSSYLPQRIEAPRGSGNSDASGTGAAG